MSLLSEIRNLAVDDSTSVSSLLRRCTVLAAGLSSGTLANWVGQELDGYPPDDQLPSYRVARAAAFGDFLGAMHLQRRHVLIPPSSLAAEHRHFATTIELRSGVDEYEGLLEQSHGTELAMSWPGDLVLYYQNTILPGMILTNAGQPVPVGVIPGMLGSLRTKILRFALELERINPEAGEATSGSQPISETVVQNIFNTYIIGDRANVAVGIGTNTALNVSPGDLGSLFEAFRRLGLPPSDVDDFERALEQDGGQPGEAVATWRTRLATKATSGAGGVVTSVVANAVWEAIKAFTG